MNKPNTTTCNNLNVDLSWQREAVLPNHALCGLVFIQCRVYSGSNDIARDRKNYVGCRENRYIRSKYKRKTPIGTEENMSDVAEIVISGVTP